MDELFVDVLAELDAEGVFGPSRAFGTAAVLYMDLGEFEDDDWRDDVSTVEPARRRAAPVGGVGIGPRLMGVMQASKRSQRHRVVVTRLVTATGSGRRPMSLFW